MQDFLHTILPIAKPSQYLQFTKNKNASKPGRSEPRRDKQVQQPVEAPRAAPRLIRVPAPGRLPRSGPSGLPRHNQSPDGPFHSQAEPEVRRLPVDARLPLGPAANMGQLQGIQP